MPMKPEKPIYVTRPSLPPLDEYVERESRILSHDTVIGNVYQNPALLEGE